MLPEVPRQVHFLIAHNLCKRSLHKYGTEVFASTYRAAYRVYQLQGRRRH